MAYTSHGHHIPGTVDNVGRPDTRARCGGVRMCKVCKEQAAAFMAPKAPVNYPEIAMRATRKYVDKLFGGNIPEYDVYVVLFAYIIGGWKAHVGTTLPDYMYYEITFDKDRGKIFVDAYSKIDQKIFTLLDDLELSDSD